MAKYRVLVAFSDLNDNNHVYRPGDEFPRAGIDVSVDRLTSLSSSSNRLGKPLIEIIPPFLTEPVTEPAPVDPVKETKKPRSKSTSKSTKTTKGAKK